MASRPLDVVIYETLNKTAGLRRWEADEVGALAIRIVKAIQAEFDGPDGCVQEWPKGTPGALPGWRVE